MKKLTLLVVVFSCFIFEIGAQNLNTHYLYQMNWFNINPAYTGYTDGTTVIINPGTQWVGMEGNPSNSMFGAHTKIGGNKGVGGKFVIDNRGLFSNFTAELSYAYKAKLTEDQDITFGISAGLYQTMLDRVSIIEDRYTDNLDPKISSEYYNSNNLLSSFGVVYTFKELEVGVSAPHLIVSGRPISDHVFGMAKYNFFVSDDNIKLTPSLVFQNYTLGPNQIDIGVMATWKESFWGQIMYKTNKTIVTSIGVNIKQFNIGYSYVIIRSALNTVSNGSHEVYIAFNFGKGFNNDAESKTLEERERLLESERQAKFQSIVNDLKLISEKEQAPADILEIEAIQTELYQLISKAKEGNLTETDEKRIEELEKQLEALKSRLGY